MIFNYNKLIDNVGLNDIAIINKMQISRTQFWRAKKGDKIGEKFISRFKKAFPEFNIDDYFFN